MHSFRQAALIALLMIAAALAPYAIVLSPKKEPGRSDFLLENLIPTTFGEWRVVENRNAQVVNPQAQQALDVLYSQLLTRTYSNASGYSIMLSIAYGDNQKGGLKAHIPDRCYPAQGFVLNVSDFAVITTPEGPLDVKRLEAQMGTRIEPITYWFKLGDRTISSMSSFRRRLVEARFALGGNVPDGLLFRVSSIDNQRDIAFARQEKFAFDLLTAIGPAGRQHLIGTAAR
jgi:EpsI family protein